MPFARHDLFLPVAVAAALIAAAFAGLPEALGAHPFWAVQTGALGAAGGAAAFVGLRLAGFRPGAALLLGVEELLASGLAVHFGKAAFVASYAENALAGRAWYLGWFALAGSACLALSGALARAASGLSRG